MEIFDPLKETKMSFCIISAVHEKVMRQHHLFIAPGGTIFMLNFMHKTQPRNGLQMLSPIALRDSERAQEPDTI